MIRMRDVAERAGVSLTTVSFVLHERPGARISDLTRNRVLRAAADLGYVVRAETRRRRGAVTRVLGLVSRELSGPDQVLARSFSLAASHRGVVSAVVTAGPEPLLMQQAVSMLGAVADGVAISASLNGALRTLAGVPRGAIFLAGPSPFPGHQAALADEHGAVRSAMEEFAVHGHRRIAIVSVQGSHSWSWHRDVAWREVLLERGLAVAQHLRIGCAGRAPDPALVRLLTLSGPERPSALFCASGEALRAVLNACRALDLAVPDDVSVVAYDDGTQVNMIEDQRITSVQFPHRDLADWAVNQLLAHGVGESHDQHEPRAFPCLLVRRRSVGDVPAPLPTGAQDR